MQITSKCPSSSNTTHSLNCIFFQRPGPALHDLPSPDLTRNNPIVKRQPQQKFFPKESKTQDENNGFMNDPVPFTSSIGSLHNGASRPERSESKTQVRDNLNLQCYMFIFHKILSRYRRTLRAVFDQASPSLVTLVQVKPMVEQSGEPQLRLDSHYHFLANQQTDGWTNKQQLMV